jgi:hypothetical protein
MQKEIKELEKKLKLFKITEKGNKAFNKLSKDKKRIAIAEDVLLQLKLKKYNVESGIYCDLHNINTDKIAESSSNLQLLIKEKGNNCNVCAMGALFMSKVNKGDKCTIKQYENIESDKIVNNLKGIFSEKELRSIEFAFEGDDIISIFNDNVVEEKHINFYNKYGDTTSRLKAIMNNIIKNKSYFKP